MNRGTPTINLYLDLDGSHPACVPLWLAASAAHANNDPIKIDRGSPCQLKNTTFAPCEEPSTINVGRRSDLSIISRVVRVDVGQEVGFIASSDCACTINSFDLLSRGWLAHALGW